MVFNQMSHVFCQSLCCFVCYLTSKPVSRSWAGYLQGTCGQPGMPKVGGKFALVRRTWSLFRVYLSSILRGRCGTVKNHLDWENKTTKAVPGEKDQKHEDKRVLGGRESRWIHKKQTFVQPVNGEWVVPGSIIPGSIIRKRKTLKTFQFIVSISGLPMKSQIHGFKVFPFTVYQFVISPFPTFKLRFVKYHPLRWSNCWVIWNLARRPPENQGKWRFSRNWWNDQRGFGKGSRDFQVDQNQSLRFIDFFLHIRLLSGWMRLKV